MLTRSLFGIGFILLILGFFAVAPASDVETSLGVAAPDLVDGPVSDATAPSAGALLGRSSEGRADDTHAHRAAPPGTSVPDANHPDESSQTAALSEPVAPEVDAEPAEPEDDGPAPTTSTTTLLAASVTPTTSAATTTTTEPVATTTTAVDAPVVTVPAGSTPSGRGEGTVDLLVNAKSAFDPWTKSPSGSTKAEMNALYDYMVVWSPYFDNRLTWYPNGLAYIDLYAIYTDPARDARSVEHPEWILNDPAGNRLFIDWGCNGSCPQYAADTGNPAFRADFVDRVGQLLARGYRGVMIDDVNLLWRISNGNGDTVLPIDPRTGAEMRLQDWQRYTVELLEMVRATYPGAIIMHNAIWYTDAPGYGSSLVRRQTAAADFVMLERGATDRGLTGGDGKFSLSTFMRFADFAHGLGTNVLLLDETASTVKEQLFNLSVYLLVNNGGDLVSTEDYPLIAPGSTWSGFTADLGDALGPRYRWSGLWRRDFTGGIVLVNDPRAPSQNVDLGVGYLDPTGTLIDGLTMGPREATYLRNP